MVDVQPLQGLRYSPEKVGDLSQIITPPFDIIDPAAQQRYYERHPYNVIRLELGKSTPSDDTLNNVYTRAATTLSEWRLQGIIYQEPAPCYYLYQQHFTYAGQAYTRTSLLARVRLEPWEARGILPHENIRKKDKEDRLNLIRACSTNLSPIMCMYDDPQGYMRQFLRNYANDPAISFTEQVTETLQEGHSLQPIANPEQITLIKDFFAQRQLYIADGHHRYTTALHYRDEVLKERRVLHPMDGVNFVLMALIDVDDPGWLVLPTHRILYDLHLDKLHRLHSKRLAQCFTVQALYPAETPKMMTTYLTRADQPSFILKTAQETLLLTPNAQGWERMKQSGHSPAWNELDVAIIQHLLLNDLLELSVEDIAEGKSLRYSQDAEVALQALHSDDAQAILFLKSIPLQQISAVSQADDRMPPKSTYLYPKLATGLVMNPLW
jgi:uncharacterized protein (DUF1015 family)